LISFAALASLLSCGKHVVVAPAPQPVVAQRAPAQVLDAFSPSDSAWAYADGRALRQAILPDLLQAASALRADVQVGLATAASECGFQPLLAIEEMLLHIRWSGERPEAWAAVLRFDGPVDRHVRCLLAIAPDARETSLDGMRAWLLPGGFVELYDGLFVVANSGVEAQATTRRLANPAAAAIGARGTLAGTLVSASLVRPNPYEMDALGIRWTPAPAGSRFELHVHFSGDTSARETETIVRDGLLQLLGSSASFDPAGHGLAERFVQGANVRREGATLDATFEMPPLAGQTALVSQLASLVARGVRLHAAWDRSGEARETIFAIAHALVDYIARTSTPGHPARFPPSAPLVPDEIPYGKRVVPNAHAYSHPSWQDIHFSSDRPTFYAYDFVTAKDGGSVVVRARGDIDGDGTTSLFELDLRLDPHGTPIVAPVIRERDPEE
jgi:hypothetical protein